MFPYGDPKPGPFSELGGQGMSLRRRTLMLAATAGLARPYLAFGETTRPLRFIPATDVTVLDPHWTPASVTRDHGALVFDTLFGLDSSGRPSPQMLEGALVEDDGRRWALKLRPGLLFHDGEGVLARDCVASITRWARRDPYGQTLMESTDELIAADDRTIIIRLKKPFPQLPIVLGKIAAPIPAMMPERLARTDPFTQVKEMIGSGPYRFVADERIAGVRTVYQRFSGYQPRQDGRLDGTTGAKVAYLERVEWNVIPDSSTAAAAMQTGEQDWWGSVDLDLLPALRRHGAIQISILDPLGQMIVMRHNHLQTPFNDVRIRRALLPAINQQDFVIAVAGNVPSLWRIVVCLFTPGSPIANDEGLS